MNRVLILVTFGLIPFSTAWAWRGMGEGTGNPHETLRSTQIDFERFVSHEERRQFLDEIQIPTQLKDLLKFFDRKMENGEFTIQHFTTNYLFDEEKRILSDRANSSDFKNGNIPVQFTRPGIFIWSPDTLEQSKEVIFSYYLDIFIYGMIQRGMIIDKQPQAGSIQSQVLAVLLDYGKTLDFRGRFEFLSPERFLEKEFYQHLDFSEKVSRLECPPVEAFYLSFNEGQSRTLSRLCKNMLIGKVFFADPNFRPESAEVTQKFFLNALGFEGLIDYLEESAEWQFQFSTMLTRWIFKEYQKESKWTFDSIKEFDVRKSEVILEFTDGSQSLEIRYFLSSGCFFMNLEKVSPVELDDDEKDVLNNLFCHADLPGLRSAIQDNREDAQEVLVEKFMEGVK